MPYGGMPYRGDYYRGDNYYRGDIFGTLGKIVKTAAGGALGFLKGGPFGALEGAAKGAGIIKTTPSFAPMNANFGPALPPLSAPGKPKPGIGGKISRLLPGGDTGYFTRRRMNVTNVKALRRAGRRVRGFLKIARRLGALPVSGGKGKKLFKTKRR